MSVLFLLKGNPSTLECAFISTSILVLIILSVWYDGMKEALLFSSPSLFWRRAEGTAGFS
ncbi:hypothetical protein RV02_GL003214 [Enterococcus gilvus]|nr:hypothetical protein RV02_GL003214 [Enterococcus gilvus]